MAAPNTLAVMNQIQSLVNGLGIFTTVVLEAQKDWANATPVCEIAYVDDVVEHFSDNGVMEDTQGFKLTIGVDFTGQTPLAAITSLTSLRDSLVYLLSSHTYLGGTPAQVGDARIRPATNRVSFLEIQGNDYLAYEVILDVRSTWLVPIPNS